MPAAQTTTKTTDIWARCFCSSRETVDAAIEASIAADGHVVTIHLDGSGLTRGGLIDLLTEECVGGYRSRYDGENIDGNLWSVLVGG